MASLSDYLSNFYQNYMMRDPVSSYAVPMSATAPQRRQIAAGEAKQYSEKAMANTLSQQLQGMRRDPGSGIPADFGSNVYASDRTTADIASNMHAQNADTEMLNHYDALSKTLNPQQQALAQNLWSAHIERNNAQLDQTRQEIMRDLQAAVDHLRGKYQI